MKTPKLPRLMTRGQIEDLHRDFAQTFEGEEEITSNGLFNWAINTQAFYNWFYPRFEQAALRAVKEKRFHKYFRTYRPMFMEWCAWEIIPCNYSDFFNGCFNALKTNSHSASYDAAQKIYQYYLDLFMETHKPFVS